MSSEEKKAQDLGDKKKRRSDLSIDLTTIHAREPSQTMPLEAFSKLAISPMQALSGENKLTVSSSIVHPDSFSSLPPSLSLSSLSNTTDTTDFLENGFYTPRFFQPLKRTLKKQSLSFLQNKLTTYSYGYRGYLEKYSDIFNAQFNAQLRRIWGINSFKEGTTQALCMDALIKLDFKFKPLVSMVGMMWLSSLKQALSLQKMLIALLEFDRTASFILCEKQGFYATYQDIMEKLLNTSYETVSEVYSVFIKAKEFIDQNCKLNDKSAQKIESAYRRLYIEFKRYSAFLESNQYIVDIKSRAILCFDKLSKQIDELSEAQKKSDKPSHFDKKIESLKKKRKEKNKSFQRKEEKEIIGKIEQFEEFLLKKEMLPILENLGKEEVECSRYEKIPTIGLPELSLEDVYDEENFYQKGILICQHFFNMIRNIRPLFYTSEVTQLYVNNNYKEEIGSIKEKHLFEDYIKEKYGIYRQTLLAHIFMLALEYIKTEIDISLDCDDVYSCIFKIMDLPTFEYNYNESHALFFKTAIYYVYHKIQHKLEPIDLPIYSNESGPSSRIILL